MATTLNQLIQGLITMRDMNNCGHILVAIAGPNEEPAVVTFAVMLNLMYHDSIGLPVVLVQTMPDMIPPIKSGAIN